MYCRVLNLMSTDVSEVRAASIIARTSETTVDIQLRTRQYIPEDSELYIRSRQNFKSHSQKALVLLDSPLKPCCRMLFLFVIILFNIEPGMPSSANLISVSCG